MPEQHAVADFGLKLGKGSELRLRERAYLVLRKGDVLLDRVVEPSRGPLEFGVGDDEVVRIPVVELS